MHTFHNKHRSFGEHSAWKEKGGKEKKRYSRVSPSNFNSVVLTNKERKLTHNSRDIWVPKLGNDPHLFDKVALSSKSSVLEIVASMRACFQVTK